MTVSQPNFITSPYFVTEPGNWHLKPGVPEEVKKEFKEFMNNMDNTKVTKSYTVPIQKINPDKRQVFGWANVSHIWDDKVLKQVTDHHNDLIDEDELEKAAYKFTKLYREGGEMHLKGGSAVMIESMVFSIEKQKALGIPEGTVPVGWWIGFEVTDDNAWNLIKSGFYKAFSIEGSGKRTYIEEEEDE